MPVCNHCARWCLDVQDAPCQQRSESVARWKLSRISRRQRLTSDTWHPPKHDGALRWPSAQWANCCKLQWPGESDIPQGKAAIEGQVKIRTSMNKILCRNTALRGVMQYNLCKTDHRDEMEKAKRKGMAWTHTSRRECTCYACMW